MLRRLWLLCSLVWGALFFYNCTTRTIFSFDDIDAPFVFGPVALGILASAMWRYVVTGRWRPGISVSLFWSS